jgi:Domain of unknown function (DUF3303)
MLFMVIERFRDNDMLPVYERLHAVGRSLPDRLEYVDSWVEASFSRCFQLRPIDIHLRARKEANEVDSGGEAGLGLVVTGGAPTELLDPLEEVLNDPSVARRGRDL